MNDSITDEKHDHDQEQEQEQEQVPSQKQNQEEESTDTDHRTRRAQEEEMDVSLAQKGGIYEVQSASDNIYKVDVGAGVCSCPDWERNEPDGGCKHLRRVSMEIKAGNVPKPNGRLPETTETTESSGTANNTGSAPPTVAPDGGLLQNTGDEQFAACMNQIAERVETLEAEINQRRTELKDLERALAVFEEFYPDAHANTNEETNSISEQPEETARKRPQTAD